MQVNSLLLSSPDKTICPSELEMFGQELESDELWLEVSGFGDSSLSPLLQLKTRPIINKLNKFFECGFLFIIKIKKL
jgi:hypothetical protein